MNPWLIAAIIGWVANVIVLFKAVEKTPEGAMGLPAIVLLPLVVPFGLFILWIVSLVIDR